MILWNPDILPSLHCDALESGCLHLAVADLLSDLIRLTGRTPITFDRLPDGSQSVPAIVIGTVRNPSLRAFAASAGIDLSSLEGTDVFERYRVQIVPETQTVLLCGADTRGAMWAVYEFCEHVLGIDPLYLWTDNTPSELPTKTLRSLILEDAPSTFRYRGWFINDEDLLSGWHEGGGNRTIDYPYYNQVVHPDVMARVIETALRLKQNLLIPASFLDIDNSPEEALVRLASERGLLVSQHHIEPLGVSSFAMSSYWRARGRAEPPSYVTDPELVREAWRHYAQRWARYPGVVWQLGLRGRGDQPIWNNDPSVPSSMEDRGALISRAMADQHAIVAEALGHEDFISTSTLWMEGSVLHEAGHLKFPENTIILFSDTQQTPRPATGRPFYSHLWGSDFYSVSRQPNRHYGIYNHVAVWGSGPHLAQGVPLRKLQHTVGEAVASGDTALAITNVSNIREVVLGVRAMADLAWDFSGFEASRFIRDWSIRQFGEEMSQAVVDLYRQFYDSMPGIPTGDSDFPALFHDGAVRESGIVCLIIMEEIISEGGEKVEPFTPQTVENLKAWAAYGINEWSALLAVARDLSPRIPQERSQFFHHHFEVQATIMLGLNEWLANLMEPLQMLTGASRDYAIITRKLHSAATAIDRAREFALASETAQWRHWYRGDHKMNLSALAAQTRGLADVIEQRFLSEKTS